MDLNQIILSHTHYFRSVKKLQTIVYKQKDRKHFVESKENFNTDFTIHLHEGNEDSGTAEGSISWHYIKQSKSIPHKDYCVRLSKINLFIKNIMN